MTSMNFDITADSASAQREFLSIAAAAERLEEKLRKLDKMTAEPSVDLNIDPANRKLDQLQRRLDALKNVRTKVELDGADQARKDVTGLVVELRKLRDAKVKLDLATGTARKDIEAVAKDLRSLSDKAIKLKVEVSGEDKLTKLKEQLDELKRDSPIKIRVEVESRGALGAFAAVLGAARNAATGINGTKANFKPGADPSPVLNALGNIRAAVAAAADDITGQRPKFRADADASQVLATLKKVESAVQTTAGKIFATRPHMQATADVAPMLSALQKAQAAVRAVVADIDGKKPTLRANADVAPVLSALSQVESSLKGVTSKDHTAKVKVDVDRGGMSLLAKLGVALATLSPIAVAAGGASTAAIASLGGAITSAVPIAVAGLGMLGGVLATVEVATNGVGAAFAAFRENDMKKFNQLLGELSPNAQAFTRTLTDLYVQLKRNAGAVQDRMFDGLSESLRRLGAVEVPLLTRGMGGVATELNKAAKEVMAYLSSGEGVARQTAMWISTRQVVGNLRPAFADIVAILSDVGEVGGKALADVTDGVGGVTQRWREWIAEARNSGRLDEIMRGGIDVFAKLGSIIGNTGSILASFYRAATAAGSDFLTTLDRGTEAAARFLKSAEGQSSLTTFFRESRAAIDAMLPGLASLGRGVMEAIRSFGETGGLSRFGAAVGEILRQVGAVLGPLGTLGGNVLKTLAQSAAIAAQAIGPIVQGLLNLINATGPVGPAIIAMVLAFNQLQKVNALVTGAGVALAGFATKAGVGEAASTRIGNAFSKMGSAIPVLGVAVVALGAAYSEFGSVADRSVQQVIQGSMSLQQAIAAEQSQVERNQLWWNSAAQKQDAYAAAASRVTAEFQKQYAALSPMQQLQADVAMSQAALNDAVAQYGAGSSQARTAADALAAAQGKLKGATDGATQASKSYSDTLRDQVQAAQQLFGSMLAVEDALARVAEAEKTANQAVAEHGASSAEAKAELNNYAQAADQAAQAIGQQAAAAAEAQAAGTGAAAQTRAYGAALLTMAANASGPAQQSILGYIAKLDDASLAALSAGSEASGFGLQIMKLPDGRTVKIAVDPETGKIISTQQLLDAMQKNPVMIQVGAITVPADQALQRVLLAVQQGQASVMIGGQNGPALEQLRAVGVQAGLEKAEVNIGGVTVNGMAALDGFIQSVKTGNPMVNIGGVDFDARAVFAALQSNITGANPMAHLQLDPSGANATLAGFKTSASAQVTMPLGMNPGPAMGTATTVRSNASQPATMPLNANPAGANATSSATRGAASAQVTFPLATNPASAQGSVNTVQGQARQPQSFPTSSTTGGASGPISSVQSQARIAQSFQVLANTGPARSAVTGLLSLIPGSRSVVITITRIFQTIGAMFENGGILPMASGGVVATTRAYATGGADDPARNQPGKMYDGHRLTPMSGNRAAEVAPRTYRVIGDRQKNTEVFIPLNGSKASLAFTGYAANEQGYGLVPLKDRRGGRMRAMASGGMLTAEDGSRVPSSFYSRTSTGSTGRVMAEDGSSVPSSFYSGSMPITFTMADGGTVPAKGSTLTLAQAKAGWFRHVDGSFSNINDPRWAGSEFAQWRAQTQAKAMSSVGAVQASDGSWVPSSFYSKASTALPASKMSTAAPMAAQVQAGQTQIHTAGSGSGGLDLSALIGEVRAVKAAVLATAPSNADVVAAVGRVERTLTARSNVAATAQSRRVESELSRI